MKFQVGDIVKYIDDGQYPAINNMRGRVVGIDELFGPKYIRVEFDVNSKITIELGIHKKHLKRIKKAIQDRQKMWYE